MDPNRPAHIENLVQAVVAWAAQRDNVKAVALVGSWARETAGAESDVDIVLLTAEPYRYLESDSWADALGVVLAKAPERWGAVTSRRGTDPTGVEIEFGIASLDWPGGDRVLREGARIVYDPVGVLAKLVR